MPKKSENPKSTAARERKKSTQEAQIAQKQKAEEDSNWEDADKNVKKKQQRKEEVNMKREQQLAKKAETKHLLEEEASRLKSVKAPLMKINRAQVGSAMKREAVRVVESLQENINKMVDSELAARSVDEALAVLKNKEDSKDKHPEKRRKAAFAVFESRRIRELKSENPELRLSQLREMVFKEWQKAPENPMNQN